MLVILSEKANQAKDYARALKGKTSYPSKHVIQVDNSTVLPEHSEIQLVFLQGHIYELQEPQEYDPKLKSWHIADLPILPEHMKFRLKKGCESMRKEAANAIANSDEFWLGTDGEVEGENIGYIFLKENHLLDRLTGRLWQNSQTDSGLAKAFHSIRKPEETKGNADAGYSRMVTDWLIGMNYSRLATLKLKELNYGNEGVFSVGRVQTPLLALISTRRVQRADFKPEDSYRLNFTDEQGLKFIADKKTGSFLEKGSSEQKIDSLNGKKLRLTDVKKQHKVTTAPKLMKTGDVQGLLVKHLDISASDALDKVLEPLYASEHAITYPRTDCTLMTVDDFEMLKDNLPKYKELYENILKKKIPDGLFNKLEPRKKYVDFTGKKVQEAGHPALLPDEPVDIESFNKFNKNEKIAYLLILKRALAIFADDFDYDDLKVVGTVSNIEFKAQNKRPYDEQLSWHDVIKVNSDDEVLELDTDAYQENFELSGTFSVKKETTTPPTAITESNLISTVMPQFHFGTQATRAGIIEGLLRRKLMVKNRKKDAEKTLNKGEFQPTRKGIILLELLEKSHLLDISKVSDWEDMMENISHGNENMNDFISDIKSTIIDEVETLPNREFTFSIPPLPQKARAKNIQQEDVGIDCPRCKKGKIVDISMDIPSKQKKGEFFHAEFYGCSERCGFSLSKVISKMQLTPDKLKQLLEGTLPEQTFISKKGKPFTCKLIYQEGSKNKKDQIAFDFGNKK